MSALPARLSAEAAAPMRRGACPALSAPMRTGDGLLVRLNLAEGGVAPGALAALCKAASRHGNGLVEITARGSFQVRGLTAASAPLFAREVNALAIPVREGVPVETSPLAGLDPAETADPLPLVRAVRAATGSAGLSRRLGPKVSVVVDGGGQIGLDEVAADVRVEAAAGGGWRVSVGGRPAAGAMREDDAVSAVLEALEAIAAQGTAARGRDLAAPVPEKPSRESRRADTIGTILLRHGLSALAVALPFGQCETAALTALADAPGIADFRFAPGRRLLALGPREACEALRPKAAALGFVTDPADPLLSIAACPGAPACASGRFATREAGRRLAAILPPGFAATIHVSGCAKGCARPAAAALVLTAGEDGFALIRDGRAVDAPFARTVDPETALDLLRREIIGTAA